MVHSGLKWKEKDQWCSALQWAAAPKYLGEMPAVGSGHLTPAIGWCAYGKCLDEDSGHKNYSILTSSYATKMV